MRAITNHVNQGFYIYLKGNNNNLHILTKNATYIYILFLY